MICIMFLKTIYNVGVISGTGFCCGITLLILNDVYRIYSKKNINSNITSLNGIPDIFNTGFYIGLVFGVLYLYNGSKLLLCS